MTRTAPECRDAYRGGFISCTLWVSFGILIKTGGGKMTAVRKRALANAVASARMEGLEISEQEKRDCLRYLDGKIDTATLVREALKRQKKQELSRR